DARGEGTARREGTARGRDEAPRVRTARGEGTARREGTARGRGTARGQGSGRGGAPLAGAPLALLGLALAGACALGAFVLANPYAVLDYGAFHAELAHQSTLSAEAQGKLGAPKDGGLVYYLWSLTWGLGWAPSLAALGGAALVWRRDWRAGLMLVPAALLFLVFMGTEGRYFGRWLMPIFPIACVLAAFFVVELLRWAAGRLARGAQGAKRRRTQRGTRGDAARASARAAAGTAVSALVVAAVLVQGLVYSVHAGLVLSRADTRNLARAWMVAHIPAGAGIVAEPAEPEEWAREVEPGTATASNPFRWRLYPALFERVERDGAVAPHFLAEVGLEDYERTLYPQLIGLYEREGYCWVISASTESGRAYADPREVPHAIAYYRALARAGTVVYRSSPYTGGAGSGRERVPFNFDWSFDYYPLAYARPGPLVTIYRLDGGRCAAAAGGARAAPRA
ncbi:MAG TPA: hypothetical protein VKV16_07190, partial [Solirubrobacteraceae bacterium]|nr:hypothetical protein [Solirubrobacteraceae bacterium]